MNLKNLRLDLEIQKDDVGLYFDSPFTEEVAKKLQKRFGNIEHKPINIVTILDDYFANTPKEQQDKDWKELKHLNNFGWELVGQKPADKIQLGKKYKCIAAPRYSTFMTDKIYKPEDKFLCSLMNFCCDCFEPIEDSEQKPILDVEIPFGAKDSELVEEAITIPDDCYAIIEDNKVILRKGEKKPSWSEEDEENLKWFEKYFRAESVISEGKDIPQDRYLWFKNLKERVHPKQEWNEEDNIILSRIIADYERSNEEWFNAQNSLPHCRKIIWLKSLKDRVQSQFTWKPSKEQMDVLKEAIEFLGCTKTRREQLQSLYEQLKKLREG